jgi:hypothetical protein
MSDPVIRITVNGKLAYTVEQAAAHYGMGPSSIRAATSRAGLQGAAKLDGKKPLYLASALDKLMAARTGTRSPA